MHDHPRQSHGIAAARSWFRLSEALAGFDRYLQTTCGVTGKQLAILRILAAGDTTLVQLRRRLVMHPATVGQIVDRIAKLGLADVAQAPDDRRSRLVTVTPAGHRLLAEAPVAGPVRLRAHADPDQAARLTAAFDEAVDAFGLARWAT